MVSTPREIFPVALGHEQKDTPLVTALSSEKKPTYAYGPLAEQVSRDELYFRTTRKSPKNISMPNAYPRELFSNKKDFSVRSRQR